MVISIGTGEPRRERAPGKLTKNTPGTEIVEFFPNWSSSFFISISVNAKEVVKKVKKAVNTLVEYILVV